MFVRGGKSFVIKETDNARDVALFVLLKVTEDNRKSGSILKETFDEALKCGWGLDRTDRAFIERTVIGTLSRMVTVDYCLENYLKKPLKRQKAIVRGVLRLSVYQLMYMDRVPDFAAINEAVKLMKVHGLDGLSGFVNGVLRAFARDLESGRISEIIAEKEYVRCSLPEWMYDEIKADYPDKYADIFDALLSERRVSVRFNLSKASDKDDPEGFIRESVRDEGFEIEPVDVESIITENGLEMPEGELPAVYELTGGGDISKSLSFKKGLISVQDVSSALVASYAAPVKDGTVMDVCAAPGGKSLALADMMRGGSGYVEARDLSEAKISLIKENIERTGFDNISVRAVDALTHDEDSLYRADILIADLPCSGLGVIAKKPDIKLNLMPYSINELRDLQRDILMTVSRYVRPKGRLVYSTCTLSRKENDQNAAWIADVLGFRFVAGGQLLPGEHNDGFYIAVFEKKY